MSEQIREQLSALMDSELPRDELRFLLRRLDSDAESLQCWSRYQFASDILHRRGAVQLRANFTETLMLRIDRETQTIRGQRGGSVLLRWAGGGAIAAAVAIVALVTTRPAGENPSPNIATVVALPAAPVLAPADVRVVAPSSSLANFDYAQPASFDTVVPMPRYDLRRRYDAGGVETLDASTPYVLLREPMRAPQTAAVPATPSSPAVSQQH